MIAVLLRALSRVGHPLGQATVRRQSRAIGRPVDRSRRQSRPPGLADERHPVGRIEAHSEGGALLLRHLADVDSLLVGRHGSPADDGLWLADHQPGEVVPIHAAPGCREQVVRQLEPQLERRERRVGQQPVALVDQLAGSLDQLVARHADSPRMKASRSSRARSVHAPGLPVPPIGCPS